MLFIFVFCITLVGAFKQSINPSRLNGLAYKPSITTFQLHSSLGLFDAIKPSVESYINIFVPTFKELMNAGTLAPFVVHWGHGIAMGYVILVAAIGSSFGWKIRKGEGNDSNFLTVGKTFREQHPVAMLVATLSFLAGGNGGITLLGAQDQPILESPHAVTAALSLSLLFLQALIPTFFEKGGPAARTLHAYLGSSIMVVLIVHGINGLNLGLSF